MKTCVVQFGLIGVILRGPPVWAESVPLKPYWYFFTCSISGCGSWGITSPSGV